LICCSNWFSIVTVAFPILENLLVSILFFFEKIFFLCLEHGLRDLIFLSRSSRTSSLPTVMKSIRSYETYSTYTMDSVNSFSFSSPFSVDLSTFTSRNHFKNLFRKSHFARLMKQSVIKSFFVLLSIAMHYEISTFLWSFDFIS
jgi:hypothetical protein